MAEKKEKKKYVVLNPHHVPPHVPVLSNADLSQQWYEGDTFEPPEGANVDWLLAQGYIREVKDG
jgi:hypothetical protein